MQGWWTIISSPVKSQPGGSNVKETSDFAKNKLGTRRYNLKSETSIWKSKHNPPKRAQQKSTACLLHILSTKEDSKRKK